MAIYGNIYSPDVIPEVLSANYNGHYQDYYVLIHNTHTGKNIAGLLDTQLAIQQQAEYSNSTLGGVEGLMKSGVSELTKALSGKSLIGQAISGVVDKVSEQIHTIYGTMSGYDGVSTPPSFSIGMHVIPSSGETVSRIVSALSELVLPHTTKGTAIMLPYTYNPSDLVGLNDSGYQELARSEQAESQTATQGESGKANTGTVEPGDSTSRLGDANSDAEELTAGDFNYPLDNKLIQVSIGNWFMAWGLFCNSVSYSFSKYVNENGEPLYIDVDLGFQCWRVLSKADFMTWFNGSSAFEALTSSSSGLGGSLNQLQNRFSR